MKIVSSGGKLKIEEDSVRHPSAWIEQWSIRLSHWKGILPLQNWNTFFRWPLEGCQTQTYCIHLCALDLLHNLVKYCIFGIIWDNDAFLYFIFFLVFYNVRVTCLFHVLYIPLRCQGFVICEKSNAIYHDLWGCVMDSKYIHASTISEENHCHWKCGRKWSNHANLGITLLSLDQYIVIEFQSN